MIAVAALVLAALVVPQQGTQQQQTEAQVRNQVQQSAAEIRRAALENARAQVEAARAQVEAQRAQIEARQNGGGVLVAPPPLPEAPSGAPRGIVVTRDGKTITIGDAGDGAAVAQAGGPGQVIFRPEIPQGAVILGVAFFIMLAFIAVGLPLARAWARRMDRQSSAPAPFPSDVTDRLERIEHAVESIAIEVERVSEGQRFTTKLLTERPEGAAAAAIPAVSRPDDYAGGGR
jgi:type II secretory pathway pseudopilin PulG